MGATYFVGNYLSNEDNMAAIKSICDDQSNEVFVKLNKMDKEHQKVFEEVVKQGKWGRQTGGFKFSLVLAAILETSFC